MKQDSFIKLIYDVIKMSIESIALPTGKTLLPSLAFSAIILIASLVSTLLNLFSFITWQGALIACCCLAILCYIERSEYDAVSRLYGDVKLRIGDIKRRTKSTSTDEQNVRPDDDNTTRV